VSADIAADGMSSIRIFLSYSHQDSEFAIKLYDDLTKVGFTVWKDNPRLNGGSSIISSIEDAICNANFFLLVLSPHSVNSSFVE
jgi:predicted nucleotide-binding protein